jgi:hypothetical protein
LHVFNNVLLVKDLSLVYSSIICPFIDVVTAYKNLKKEKEALESTVQVLSTPTEPPPTTDNEASSNAKEVIVFTCLECITYF